MGTFEFKNYACSMTIAGKDFTVSCNSDMGDFLLASGRDMQNFIETCKDNPNAKDQALNKIKAIIDGILGASAFDAIFANRAPTVSDATDVLLFITDEVIAFTKQNGLNRQQRRANKKRGTVG